MASQDQDQLLQPPAQENQRTPSPAAREAESDGRHVSWKGSPPLDPLDIERQGKRDVSLRGGEGKGETEAEKWSRLLVGKKFEFEDDGMRRGVGFRPVEKEIVMPMNVRYIIDVENCDYDDERLSVVLDHNFVVKSVYFG